MTESGYSCARCKEKLIVTFTQSYASGSFMLIVRPRRVSSCHNYKPGLRNRVCQGEGVTKDQALSLFVEPGHGVKREVVRDE